MKLSIIIPIYNSEKYLRECIESILKQTFKDFELILIDDGSTDGSGEICDEYKMKNDNIKVVHKSNKGQARRRNDGISIAAGDYILMVDSDDMIEPDMCSTMISYIKKYDADCVCAGYKRLFSDGSMTEYPEFDMVEVYENSDIIKDTLLKRFIGAEYKSIKPMMPSACTKIYKRSTIVANNVIFQDVKKIYSEDLLFNFEFFNVAKTVVCLPDMFYIYRHNDISTSNSYNADRSKSIVNLYNRISSYPYISRNRENNQMLSADIMGLFSVSIKLLVASDEPNKMGIINDFMNDKTIHKISELCVFSKINFPLNLFCILIRYKMKYVLYFMIKVFLLINGR